MLLGADGDDDTSASGHDEKDPDQTGNAGAEVSWRTRRGREPAVRPGHDDAKPGYTLPVHLRQCHPSPVFPRVSYSRSLISK